MQRQEGRRGTTFVCKFKVNCQKQFMMASETESFSYRAKFVGPLYDFILDSKENINVC